MVAEPFWRPFDVDGRDGGAALDRRAEAASDLHGRSPFRSNAGRCGRRDRTRRHYGSGSTGCPADRAGGDAAATWRPSSSLPRAAGRAAFLLLASVVEKLPAFRVAVDPAAIEQACDAIGGLVEAAAA